MKKKSIDFRLLSGLLIAHILLFITYHNINSFWYLYTSSIILLISFAIIKNELIFKIPSAKEPIFSLISGILLYGLFFLGNDIFHLLQLDIAIDVKELYQFYEPLKIWHYIALIVLIIPGEEIFWRGFIQKRLSRYLSPLPTIILSTFMYTLPLVYAENLALLLAGIVSGLLWGTIFQKSNNLLHVILSHLTFDLLLIIVFPLV